MWVQVALWLLAMYGAMVLLWQWTQSFWFKRQGSRPERTICFIVITYNAERDIEAVLHAIYGRCLQLRNPARVHVIDAQSTDLTGSIVRCFSSQFMPVEFHVVGTMGEAAEFAKQLQVADDSIRCIIRVQDAPKPDTLVR